MNGHDLLIHFLQTLHGESLRFCIDVIDPNDPDMTPQLAQALKDARNRAEEEERSFFP